MMKTNQQEFGKNVGECDEDNVQQRGKWYSEKQKEYVFNDAFPEQENGRHTSFSFP